MAWTNFPIPAGTPMTASHFNEIIARINKWYAATALGPGEETLSFAEGNRIQASNIQLLRQKIEYIISKLYRDTGASDHTRFERLTKAYVMEQVFGAGRTDWEYLNGGIFPPFPVTNVPYLSPREIANDLAAVLDYFDGCWVQAGEYWDEHKGASCGWRISRYSTWRYYTTSEAAVEAAYKNNSWCTDADKLPNNFAINMHVAYEFDERYSVSGQWMLRVSSLEIRKAGKGFTVYNVGYPGATQTYSITDAQMYAQGNNDSWYYVDGDTVDFNPGLLSLTYGIQPFNLSAYESDSWGYVRGLAGGGGSASWSQADGTVGKWLPIDGESVTPGQPNAIRFTLDQENIDGMPIWHYYNGGAYGVLWAMGKIGVSLATGFDNGYSWQPGLFYQVSAS